MQQPTYSAKTALPPYGTRVAPGQLLLAQPDMLSTLGAFPRLSRGRQRLLLLCVVGVLLRLTVFARQRTGEEYASIDADALIQIAIVGVVGLVLLASNLHLWISRISRSAAFWWFAFCAVGIVSTLWSQSPRFTLYRAGELTLLSLAIFILVLNARNWLEAESLVLWLVWIGVLASMIGTSRLHGWSIFGLRNNTYGAMAAMLACYSYGIWISSNGKRRKRFRNHFVAAAFMTVYSLSLASWWAMLLGIVVTTLLSKRRAILLVLILVAGAAALIGGEHVVQKVILRDRETAEVESLHGRKFLWEHYLRAFMEKPLTGYGFAVGAREAGPIYTTNTHNSLISVLIGCGLIGMVPVIGWLARGTHDLLRLLRRQLPMAVGITGAFIAGGANSMANALLGETWTPGTYVFCCFFALFLYLHAAWRMSRRAMAAAPAARASAEPAPVHSTPHGIQPSVTQ